MVVAIALVGLHASLSNGPICETALIYISGKSEVAFVPVNEAGMPLAVNGTKCHVPAPEPRLLPGMTICQLEEMCDQTCNSNLLSPGGRRCAARWFTDSTFKLGLYPNSCHRVFRALKFNDEGQAGQQGGFISQEVVTAGKLRLNRCVAKPRNTTGPKYAWRHN